MLLADLGGPTMFARIGMLRAARREAGVAGQTATQARQSLADRKMNLCAVR
jgi:hypothetical protein